jgi:hypothetical protein
MELRRGGHSRHRLRHAGGCSSSRGTLDPPKGIDQLFRNRCFVALGDSECVEAYIRMPAESADLRVLDEYTVSDVVPRRILYRRPWQPRASIVVA